MTYQAFKGILDTIGLQYTYRSFPIGNVPELPYFVFYFPSSDDFGADNINYVRIDNVNIELYTENKDFETEKQVETILTQNGFYFDKSETYIQQEQMYEVLYTIQIITE